MSAHRPVGTHAHDRVGGAPNFAAIIEGHDPDKILLFAIINNGEGETVALADDGYRKLGGQLRKCHDRSKCPEPAESSRPVAVSSASDVRASRMSFYAAMQKDFC